ncbi:MAG TPA: pilus assembly protein TadG-related protein [Jatrophihabitantaceae bacterium]|nr:pilus assembly protein TadG-related protein [Jatrophihabitantaceae bacterium]
MNDRERGSTLPLVIGFFALGTLVAAGAVAAGDAFVQQRGLQAVCDGAALAAAAGSADLDRAADVAESGELRFSSAEAAVADYLARDPGRREVQAMTTTSVDERTIEVRCVEVRPVTFGALFGRPRGIRHVVRSSARAPLSPP